jgi:hypothetical protein
MIKSLAWLFQLWERAYPTTAILHSLAMVGVLSLHCIATGPVKVSGTVGYHLLFFRGHQVQ